MVVSSSPGQLPGGVGGGPPEAGEVVEDDNVTVGRGAVGNGAAEVAHVRHGLREVRGAAGQLGVRVDVQRRLLYLAGNIDEGQQRRRDEKPRQAEEDEAQSLAHGTIALVLSGEIAVTLPVSTEVAPTIAACRDKIVGSCSLDGLDEFGMTTEPRDRPQQPILDRHLRRPVEPLTSQGRVRPANRGVVDGAVNEGDRRGRPGEIDDPLREIEHRQFVRVAEVDGGPAPRCRPAREPPRRGHRRNRSTGSGCRHPQR
jgi:hypothetical protein